MGCCGAMNIKAEADEDIEISRDGAPRKVCEPGFRQYLLFQMWVPSLWSQGS